MSIYDDVQALQQQMEQAQTEITALKTAGADSGWIDLQLSTGITAHSVANFPCRYRKIGNRVFVEGCVLGVTSVDTVVATLPEGYRPSKSFYHVTAANGGYYDTFNVRNNGELKLIKTTIPTMYDTQFHFINAEFLTD